MIRSQNYESCAWKILIFLQTDKICKATCIDYLSWRAGAVLPNPAVSTSRTCKLNVYCFAVHNADCLQCTIFWAMKANKGLVEGFSLIFLFSKTGVVIGTCFEEAPLKVIS